jgi:hypothetical protein
VGTRPERLSLGASVAIVVATLVAGALAVKVVPGAVTHRINLLLHDQYLSADPAWNAPVDGAAFRKARGFVSRGDTYYLLYPNTKPEYMDVPAAGLLFLMPAKPVNDPMQATWILSYQAGIPLPPSVRPGARYRLGSDIFLVRTQPR